MKALREKRVSLRSLFRRSLVILSLLALAFAVSIAGCSSDSDSGDNGNTGNTGNTGDTGNTGSTVAAPPTVVGLQVIKHPNMPSFEGAEPSLEGITVAVTWSDNKTVLESDASKFAVSPPIAFVANAGTNAGFNKQDYKVRYVGENAWFDYGSAYQVPIYIPAVIALAKDTVQDPTSNGYPAINGKIAEIYEDQGIVPDGVEFEGIYEEFKFDASTSDYKNYIYLLAGSDATGTPSDDLTAANANARDAGYMGAADMFLKDKYDLGMNTTIGNITPVYAVSSNVRWPVLPAISGSNVRNNIRSNKISGSADAWDLGWRDSSNDTIKPRYKVNTWAKKLMTATTNSPLLKVGPSSNRDSDMEVSYSAFYYVARLDYKTGIENLKPFAADDPNFQAINDASVEFITGQSAGVYPGNGTGMPPANNNRLPIYSTSSTIAAPSPATGNFDPYTGYNYNADKIEVVKRNWINALFNAGVEFTVRYYIDKDAPDTVVKSRDIKMAEYIKAMNTKDPYTNKPRATLPFFAGNPDFPARSSVVDSVIEDYELALRMYYYSPKIVDLLNINDTTDKTPDAAIINVSNAIYRYGGLALVRADKSDHEEPQVRSGFADTANATAENKKYVNLYSALQPYWKLVYQYYKDADNPSGDAIELDVSWPSVGDTSANGYSMGATTATIDAQAAIIRNIITDVEFDDVEGGVAEKREGAITILAPASAEWDEAEVTFPYYMLP